MKQKIIRTAVSHGMQQALGYAEILQVPSIVSFNGDAFASHNKVAGEGEEIETRFPLESFPPPDDIWQCYKKYRGMEGQGGAPDFFDMIVIDECHCDSAADDSAWREILSIFHPASFSG